MPKFIRKQVKAKNCPICKGVEVVDYKNTDLLLKHVSERGKILGRARTGVCAGHQRQITRSVKRARYMALLPFSQS